MNNEVEGGGGGVGGGTLMHGIIVRVAIPRCPNPISE